MATYIGTNNEGNLTYENEPETNKTLFKNDTPITASNVNTLIESKGYTTETDVKEIVNEEGYIKSTDVMNAVNSSSEFLLARNWGASGSSRQVVVTSMGTNDKASMIGTATSSFYINGQWGVEGGSANKKSIAISTSDIRLKDNIKKCKKSGLDVINEIDVVEFDWKDVARHWDFGIIAQDVRKIDDNMVVGEETENSYLSINNLYVIDILIKAVQELSAKVNELTKG